MTQQNKGRILKSKLIIPKNKADFFKNLINENAVLLLIVSIFNNLYSPVHSGSGIGTGFPIPNTWDFKLVARGSLSQSLTSSL